MRIIDQSFEIIHAPTYQEALELVEGAGRTCYLSEPKGDPRGFVRSLLHRGHESVIEHPVASVKITTNRGITHELVRHRLASYSQESTRYCNYGNTGLTFIRSHKLDESVLGEWKRIDLNRMPATTPGFYWLLALLDAEFAYESLLRQGWKPEDARGVLPNDLKTTIVMTCNFREWRHVFKLRTSLAAHPQIRKLTTDMLWIFVGLWPVFFEDLTKEKQ